MSEFGIAPQHLYALLWPLAAILLWARLRKVASARNLSIMHDASLQASFWEELLFRGLVLGALLKGGYSTPVAITLSSLLFGIFHFRNLWWAGWRRCLEMSLYAGIIAGPLFAVARAFTGDIYLGIFLHFAHNTFMNFPPAPFKGLVSPSPTDATIRAAQDARR